MKKAILAGAAILAACLFAGCSSQTVSNSADGETSATSVMLPLGEDVTVRVGTDANGEILLDGNTMEGFFASDHYTDESPYGFALVLTGDGDANSTPAMTRAMAAMAPHGRAVVIEGHRHMVNLTAPEAVTAELQRWLETEETLA